MTARVERPFHVDAPLEDVWEFLVDPANRASAIGVVQSFDRRGDTTIWHIELPIPLVRKTIPVRTRDVTVDPPEFVRFRGKSSAFDVQGEHRIEADGNGTRVQNTFLVDGRVPGVEGYFRRNLDAEITNLERALKAHLEES